MAGLELFLGLAFIIYVYRQCTKGSRPPKPGTQEAAEWLHNGDKYWIAANKLQYPTLYKDAPITPSEKAAYNKVEKENGRPGID